jgi:hypothetical protein
MAGAPPPEPAVGHRSSQLSVRARIRTQCRAALAGCVPALEHNADFRAGRLHPLLQRAGLAVE